MKKLNILFLSLALAFVASCSSTKEEQLNPSAETLCKHSKRSSWNILIPNGQ